ncbi:MAG: DUF3192 domain-containing protein [Desulfobacca sp.]|uniref:DUF3192 domain-containing protein n=1 Tax=Desulfobacca sp. TaxID=2067990 RepID=UPI00404A75DD
MMRLFPFLLALLLGWLPACGTVLYPRLESKMWTSYFHLQEIKPGMSTQEVISKMGPPRVTEEGASAGLTVLMYQTHTMDTEGSETIRGGLTPLVFQDDRLVGLGQRAYNRAMAFPNRDAINPPYVLPR